jgi:hypothetical protein
MPRPTGSRSKLDSFRAAVYRVVPERVYWCARRLVGAVVAPYANSIRTGHLRSSLTGSIVDRHGDPLPWYSQPAIDLLRAIDFSDRDVLEFGAGQSTLWWQARARSVASFEASREWYDKTATRIGANVELFALKTDDERSIVDLDGQLERAIGDRRFDVIVVDGVDRLATARRALRRLTDDGVVIVDNSDERAADGTCPILALFRDAGLRRIDLYGLAPGNLYSHCTSLQFRDGSFIVRGEADTRWVKPFDQATYNDVRFGAPPADI